MIVILKSNKSWLEYSKSKAKNLDLLKKALVESYVTLDKRLRSSDQVEHGLDQSGCTAVTVVITPTHIVCASIGDSRAVVAVSAGKKVHAIPLSEDHKPDNFLERKRIESAGGFVQMDRVNGELAMSRAIGDFQYKSNSKLSDAEQMVISIPDVAIHKRSSNDLKLLVACDGVFDVFDNQEAVEALFQIDKKYDLNTPLKEQKIAGDLINLAIDNGSTDNVSAIIVSL